MAANPKHRAAPRAHQDQRENDACLPAPGRDPGNHRSFDARGFEPSHIRERNIAHDFRVSRNRTTTNHTVKVEWIPRLGTEEIDNRGKVEGDSEFSQFLSMNSAEAFGFF